MILNVLATMDTEWLGTQQQIITDLLKIWISEPFQERHKKTVCVSSNGNSDIGCVYDLFYIPLINFILLSCYRVALIMDTGKNQDYWLNVCSLTSSKSVHLLANQIISTLYVYVLNEMVKLFHVESSTIYYPPAIMF